MRGRKHITDITISLQPYVGFFCKLYRGASYKALMRNTAENLSNNLFSFHQSVTKHNIHRWMPQWICTCCRTVNKYQFIKLQYLLMFFFLLFNEKNVALQYIVSICI